MLCFCDQRGTSGGSEVTKVWSFVASKALHIMGARRNGKSTGQGKGIPIIKKMSVDASRVDPHSNHIINNTKTNNQ